MFNKTTRISPCLLSENNGQSYNFYIKPKCLHNTLTRKKIKDNLNLRDLGGRRKNIINWTQMTSTSKNISTTAHWKTF